MRKSDSFIMTILGMRGCGKSTLTQALAKGNRHIRKIVFDFVEEWRGTHLVHSYEQFASIWRKVFHLEKFTIVVRFAFGTPEAEIINIQTKITRLIYLTGKDTQKETTLVFEEAHFYFPNNRLHPINMHLLTTGRHAYINIIGNSQRPASVSKLLISQSAEIYIGSLFELNDMKYLTDTVGTLALEARKLKKFQFIFYPVGKPEGIAIINV